MSEHVSSKLFKTQKRLGSIIFLFAVIIVFVNIISMIWEQKLSIDNFLINNIPILIIGIIGFITKVKQHRIFQLIQVLIIFIVMLLTMLTSTYQDLSGEFIAILGIFICIQYGFIRKKIILKVILIALFIASLKFIIIIFVLKNNSNVGLFIKQYMLIAAIVSIFWWVNRERIKEYVKIGKEKDLVLYKNSTFIDIGKIGWSFLHDLGAIGYAYQDIKKVKRELDSDEKLTDSFKYKNIKRVSRALNIISDIIKKEESISSILKSKHTDLNLDDYINVKKIIENRIDFFKMTDAFKHVKIVKNFPDDNVYIKGSLFEIAQSFENILRNCFEAMQSTNNEIPSLRINLISENNLINLTIQDCGGGISFSKIDGKIDLKEFKIGRTTKNEKGTGWGMYNAIQNIKKNKGKIEIYSIRNIGTTFKIIFKKEDQNER